MRSAETEAHLAKVREAVTGARHAGVTVEACLWDAAVAAVDKGSHGVPSLEARRLADHYVARAPGLTAPQDLEGVTASKCSRLLGQCGHVFHCPKCGRGSSNPGDAENRYCGVCGFVDVPAAPAQEHAALTAELADALATWQARVSTVCEHTQIISYGEAAEALAKVVEPRLAQLRDELARRTREWQDEQRTRVAAEQARIGADQRTEQLRDALRRFADRLTGGPAAVDVAREMRTLAEQSTVAAGTEVDGAIVCGRGEPAPTTAAAAARVYVSGPYSAAPEACLQTAIDAADELLRHGYAPLVPHLKHPWITQQTGHGYEDWLRLDLAWVEAADALLRLPGESPGADREVAHAIAHGIPVVHDLADLPIPQDDVPAFCRVCGCTEDRACPGGCTWIPDPTGQGDLCNRCAGAILRVTVEDLDNGDRACCGVPAGTYSMIAAEPCTYDVAVYPGGIHVITVKNIQEGNWS